MTRENLIRAAMRQAITAAIGGALVAWVNNLSIFAAGISCLGAGVLVGAVAAIVNAPRESKLSRRIRTGGR